MIGKKAFVKTIEVLIAVIMTFVFLIIILPDQSENVDQKSLKIINSFEDNENFRNCVIDGNEGCINEYIENIIPPYLEYEILITDDANSNIDLPEQKVYVETLYFAGNITTYSPKILKLFYWQRG